MVTAAESEKNTGNLSAHFQSLEMTDENRGLEITAVQHHFLTWNVVESILG